MAEKARFAFGLALQLLVGCGQSATECVVRTAGAPSTSGVLADTCHEWPYPPALRAQLTERAFELLEAIYAGGPAANATSLLAQGGVSIAEPRQAESGPLELRLVPPARYREIFEGELARRLMGGMYGLRGRAVDVGAHWNDGADRACVANTERTEGMFEAAVYVHVFRTAAEVTAGYPNGIILIFQPDADGEWRVTALFQPEQGV